MAATTTPVVRQDVARSALGAMYEAKPEDYFACARTDIVDALPSDQNAAILELGCGNGATGAAALAAGKCGRYVGIDIDPGAAAEARTVLSAVLVGDVCALDLSAYEGQFDVLIASEVLEHLTDPWEALRALRRCLKPGALVFASSPNVAHRAIIWQLLRGRFDYAPSGPLDRTHLRWFTPATYRELLEDTGFVVDRVYPVEGVSARGKLRRILTGGLIDHLFTYRIMLSAHVPQTLA
jgi:2-polyprenyl-3-methyl-5-hydroxy-6-metoxy-1,4-benzoquinol methylase